jgi:nicotinamidase-related amidase
MKSLLILFSILFLYFNLANSKDLACDTSSINSALVIIDMQPHFVTRGGNQNSRENNFKVGQIIGAQIEAIKKAISANIPIVFIEYENVDPTSDLLKAAVKNYHDVKFFTKSTDGMFDNENKYKNQLVSFLKDRKIGTLVMTGANGGACVKESILGALNENCNVVAFSKGIADFNYVDFIYPYKGQYKDLGHKCQNCSFQEKDLIKDIEIALQSGVPFLIKGRSPSKRPGGVK